MTKETVEFRQEQVYQLARTNARGLALGAVAYLRLHEVPVRPFWEFIGQHYTGLWPEHLAADEAAEAIALNMVSSGACLVSLIGDTTQAEIVLEDWPGAFAAEMFDLDEADADETLAVFVPIAEHMGYEFTWRRDGHRIIAVLAR